MKALLFNPVPAVCLRWKPLATLALSLSAAWPAWTAAPFTINGNGTVTDAVTSLVWDQCIVGRTGSDCATDDAVLSRLYTWPAALAAATAANAANYKGFNDWRLPNVKELESITKLDTWTSGQAAIDADAFPNTPISGDDWGGGATWTSTTFTPYPDGAWIVLFDFGSTGANHKTYSFYVRLVRSGQSLASFDLLGAPADTTPPLTTAGPSISSGPTQTGVGLSVTIDEVGTGYWLLVPASAAAPTPAQVVAGGNYGAVTVAAAGSTAMTAATPATISLSGLTVATSYTLYFVAKDTADNLQAAVASVAVTTADLTSQTITGFAPTSPVVFGATPATLGATGGASGQPAVLPVNRWCLPPPAPPPFARSAAARSPSPVWAPATSPQTRLPVVAMPLRHKSMPPLRLTPRPKPSPALPPAVRWCLVPPPPP